MESQPNGGGGAVKIPAAAKHSFFIEVRTAALFLLAMCSSELLD